MVCGLLQESTTDGALPIHVIADFQLPIADSSRSLPIALGIEISWFHCELKSTITCRFIHQCSNWQSKSEIGNGLKSAIGNWNGNELR